jgi:hypothetical protein
MPYVIVHKLSLTRLHPSRCHAGRCTVSRGYFATSLGETKEAGALAWVAVDGSVVYIQRIYALYGGYPHCHQRIWRMVETPPSQ